MWFRGQKVDFDHKMMWFENQKQAKSGQKYDQPASINEMLMKNIFGGTSESLFVKDMYQFDDYSKYVSTAFSQEEKEKRRKEEFPNDCKKAFDMGVRLVFGGGKVE